MRSTLGLFGLAAVASATQHVVNVGKGGLLRFEPNNTVAENGDTVLFKFSPKNHTVTQGNFKTPCQVGNLTGDSFFSGFMPVASGVAPQAFEVTVEDASKPIWFFCSQGNHCQKGMVGAINAPATGNTLDAYAANAAKAKSSEIPPGGPHGGTLVDSGSSSSSSSNSSSSDTGSGGSSAVSSVAGSTSTPAPDSGYSGSSPTTVGSSVTGSSTSTATSTSPAQQTKNAAASLGAYSWRELFGLVAAAGSVAAYMA